MVFLPEYQNVRVNSDPRSSPLSPFPEIKNALNVCMLLQADIVSHTSSVSTQEEAGRDDNVQPSSSVSFHNLCLQQAAHLQRTKALLLQQSMFEALLNDSYVLHSQPVDLAGLQKSIQAYGNADSITISTDKSNSGNSGGAGTAFQLDDSVTYHVISNLVDNANKYGGWLTPPSVDLMLASTWESADATDGHCIFDFSSNRGDGVAPMGTTAATFLRIRVANSKGENHEELRQCSPSQLQRLFVKGATGSFQHTVPSAESRGHGSWIMMKCLAALSGKLLMAVEESRVCMQIILPVAITEAEEPRNTPIGSMWIAVLEDSALQRKMIKRVLSKEFPNVNNSNVVVHGATLKEIRAFPDFVLSHEPPFTTIIIDQHLGRDENNQMVKGTDIVKTLRQLGCVATILINSANGNQRDVKEYLDAGADAHLNKDSSPAEMRRAMLRKSHSTQGGKPT
jgi:CheY-like chemotaxis protein